MSILVLAFFVRAVGVRFGLPDLYHADEPIIVNHAVAFASGDLNPHFFKIPPLVSYLLFGLYGIYFLAGRILGFFSSVDDFGSLFLVEPSAFYLLGRGIFGVVLGTLTVYLLYRLIRDFFSRECGLVAAFFLACCFLHVRDSHYLYVDIPLVSVFVLCLFPIFRILEGGQRGSYVLFGLLAGVAVATKYNGVFVWIPFLTAHFYRHGFRPAALLNRDLVLSGVATLGTYSLLNPFGWIDFPFFLQELGQQASATSSTGLFHHLVYSLNGGIGTPMLLLSFLGVVRKKDPKKWVLISFVLFYYGLLCLSSQKFDRYVLPLVPVFIILAADALAQIRSQWKLNQFLFVFILFLIALPSIAKVCLSDLLFLRKDIRTVAREWVEQTIPKNSKVALDSPLFMPRLKPSLGQLVEKKRELESHQMLNEVQIKRLQILIREAMRDRSPRYELFFLTEERSKGKFLFAKPTVPYDVEALREAGIEYVLIGRFGRKASEELLKRLEKEAILVADFTPFKEVARREPIDRLASTGGPFLWRDLIGRERNGQPIEVYRLK